MMDTNDPGEEDAAGFLMDLDFAQIRHQRQSSESGDAPVNFHVGPAMTVSAICFVLFLSINFRNCSAGYTSFHGLGPIESYDYECPSRI